MIIPDSVCLYRRIGVLIRKKSEWNLVFFTNLQRKNSSLSRRQEIMFNIFQKSATFHKDLGRHPWRMKMLIFEIILSSGNENIDCFPSYFTIISFATFFYRISTIHIKKKNRNLEILMNNIGKDVKKLQIHSCDLFWQCVNNFFVYLDKFSRPNSYKTNLYWEIIKWLMKLFRNTLSHFPRASLVPYF